MQTYPLRKIRRNHGRDSKAARIANADPLSVVCRRDITPWLPETEEISRGTAAASCHCPDCHCRYPPVLILDEATSSIDTRTESLIEKGMDQLMKGRTVFCDRPPPVHGKKCNAIMVLEHGKIIERGTHEELLEMKGEYYQLYNGMFELS